MKIDKKLAASRYWVAQTFPYYSKVLWSLEVVETDKMPQKTMGVSKNWVLYYDPDFVKEHEIEFLGIVLVHEIHHMLRKHL